MRAGKCDLDLAAKLIVGGTNSVGVFCPRLLHNRQSSANVGAQATDCRRNDFRHHARALATTKNKQILFWIRYDVARPSNSNHLWAHWVAGERHFALPVGIEVFEHAESGGNRSYPWRQEFVGATHDTVLLVQDGRHPDQA
jgi:hypothetical protein